MLDVLTGFISELREVGVPVSLAESLDASEAVMQVPLADAAVLKQVLGATLVKSSAHWKAFETAFDIYFSHQLSRGAGDDGFGEGIGERRDTDDVTQESGTVLGAAAGIGAPGAPAGALDGALLAALVEMDRRMLASLARRAVAQFAGIVPKRPVAGTYYLFRTLRNIDFDGLGGRLLQELTERSEPRDGLGERLVADEASRRMGTLRAQIEAEIRRLLVADRGAQAVARTARRPLPEDVDFMHATREELQAMRLALEPLARKLATRMSWKRRHGCKGPLDFRGTIRRSLSTGGVPVEPAFKYPRPARPEIFVLADVSGSVASFSRFTLQLLHAMSTQFSRVRSFVFVDGIDEVTRWLAGRDLNEAMAKINAEADVTWLDGHSDYGHAFESFWERFGREVNERCSVIILGDARNNYHASGSWVLEEMRRRARHVYWLNPEPRGYWGSGDSILEQYSPHCDAAFECRSLRQLEQFVKALER